MMITQSKKQKVQSKKLSLALMEGQSLNAGTLKVLCFLLFTLSFSCSTSGKEEKQPAEATSENATWTVTVRGKVGFPQQGQIMIQEIKDGSIGWQDTIGLKGNYTFAK